MREGAALLQGIAKCGRCGRGLRVYYRGRNSTPGYYCAGNTISNGRGEWCMRVSGLQVDKAVAETFIAELAPAGLEAALKAAEQLESDHDRVLVQFTTAQSNERSMKHSEPSAVIVRSILRTG